MRKSNLSMLALTLIWCGLISSSSQAADSRMYWLNETGAHGPVVMPDMPRSALQEIAGGYVVYQSEDGVVHWLKDGQRVSEFAVPGTPPSDVTKTKLLILSDGTVVIGSSTGFVYWLKEGRRIHTYQAQDDSFVGVTPVVLRNGTVVIGGWKGVYWLRNGRLMHKFSDLVRTRDMAVLPDGETVVLAGAEDETDYYTIWWLRAGIRLSETNFWSLFETFKVLPDGSVIVEAEEIAL